MARLIWTEAAQEDLEAITAFIARDSVTYARRMGQRLRAAPKRLKRFPQIGSIVPEFERETLRELFVGPYRIIYEIQGSVCYVVAIVHGRRLLPRALRPSGGEPESL